MCLAVTVVCQRERAVLSPCPLRFAMQAGGGVKGGQFEQCAAPLFSTRVPSANSGVCVCVPLQHPVLSHIPEVLAMSIHALCNIRPAKPWAASAPAFVPSACSLSCVSTSVHPPWIDHGRAHPRGCCTWHGLVLLLLDSAAAVLTGALFLLVSAWLMMLMLS